MLTPKRLCVVLALCAFPGCSDKPSAGALLVLVNLEPHLISRCARVSLTDGALQRETRGIPLDGKESPLRVGVYPDGLAQVVTVQAVGYADVGCTSPSGEVSESISARFADPAATVTVTLSPVVGDFGIDNDHDGSPAPVDCDDSDPAVHPGAPELCSNGRDDDCDSQTDCQQPSCDASTCSGGGVCSGLVCTGSSELLCNDGADNDADGLIDCADPDCPTGSACTDSNSCTLGDVCVSDGGCEKVADKTCTTPPNALCYRLTGTCLPDAGAACQYTSLVGSCDDGLACTASDVCGAGTCSGTPRTCNAPGNVCLAATGSCEEPTGICRYAPLATGSCDDGQNCTINDTCDGDGGCVGVAVSCTAPSQCHVATGACDTDGGCLFGPRTGLPCDAGTAPGSCTASFSCVQNGTFPFAPANFTEAQLPSTDGGVTLAVTCNTTITTSGTPSIASGCGVVMPPAALVTPPGGEPTLLLAMNSLSVSAGQTLIIQGSRPIILAVIGNASISGTIRALNLGSAAACGSGGNGGATTGLGGGGGGGFGSAGAAGGARTAGGAGTLGLANGVDTLKPLRGGCRGGNGSGTGGTGGDGGGALQISASGSVTVTGTGVITAPGQFGRGATGVGASGGGGGSGGGVLLEALTLRLNAGSWLSANGGAGGGGQDQSSGGNGQSGSETSNAAALGGSADNGAGLGGEGATGSAAAVAGVDGIGAGGGGAGAGRIRLDAATCSVDPASNLSPTATSNGGSGCP